MVVVFWLLVFGKLLIYYLKPNTNHQQPTTISFLFFIYFSLLIFSISKESPVNFSLLIFRNPSIKSIETKKRDTRKYLFLRSRMGLNQRPPD